MTKTGRPVIYTVVAAVAIYAIVLLTEPEPTTRKVTNRVVRQATTDGISREDLNARFDRYSGTPRDAFRPLVLPSRRGGSGGGSGDAAAFFGSGATGASTPKWSLTGISVLNGERMALIESATGDDHRFLTTGDTWSGLRVVAIEEDAVVFVNALGQRSRITFAEPEEQAPARPAAPAASTAPVGGVGAIPPLPVLPQNVAPGAPAPGVAPQTAAPAAPADGADGPGRRGRRRF